MSTIAVIVAAGTGQRMGTAHNIPKQYIEVEGHEILWYSVKRFAESPRIDRIAIVSSREWIDHVLRTYHADEFGKPIDCILGGANRDESCRNALARYECAAGEETNILIHDGARPLVSLALIERVLVALRTHRAVTPTIPLRDTVWGVRDNGTRLSSPIGRDLHASAQTPQGFRYSLLRDAYAALLARGIPSESLTDSCSVIRAAFPHEAIGIARGEEENIKLTTPIDLEVIRAYLRGGQNSQ